MPNPFLKDDYYDQGSSVLPLGSHTGENETYWGTDESGKPQLFTRPKYSFAVPEMVSSFGNALTAPGRAYQGKIENNQLLPEALNFTQNLATGGMGAARPGNSLGIFGGRRANTVNPQALSEAMSMESKGHSPEEIWQRTKSLGQGWFRDVDRKWKFEIPDTEAKLNEGVLRGSERAINVPAYGVKLNEILQHPELYENYPQLANTSVRSSFNPGAFYNEDADLIGIGFTDKDSYLSNLLHETQHTVQGIENFARGSSINRHLPENFNKDFSKALRERLDTHGKVMQIPVTKDESASWVNPHIVIKAVDKVLAGKSIAELRDYELQHVFTLKHNHPELYEKLLQTEKEYQKMNVVKEEAKEKYLKSAGEVEARNVQERHSSNNYITHPHKTEGYYPKNQIIEFGDDDISPWSRK